MQLDISLEKMEFKKVEKCTYLGIRITRKTEIRMKSEVRIIKTNQESWSDEPFSYGDPVLEECNVWKFLNRTHVKSSVCLQIFGGEEECTRDNKKMGKKTTKWVIRERMECGYVMRCNEELYSIYSNPAINIVVKRRRLQWSGMYKGQIRREQ